MSIFDAICSVVTSVSDALRYDDLLDDPDEKTRGDRKAQRAQTYQSSVGKAHDRTYTQDEAVDMLDRIHRYNKYNYRKIHPYIEITHTPVEIKDGLKNFISPELGYTGETPEEYVTGGYEITLTISGGDYIDLTSFEKPEE